MILLTPKARKTSCSDVCKSARAGHRRNSGERSKATELGLVGSRRLLKETSLWRLRVASGS